jgi:hypothetical protein
VCERAVSGAEVDPQDDAAGPAPERARPLVHPLTISQVMEITGRSKRTIERWTTQGLLTPYELTHPREIVFVEDEVLEVESRKSRAQYQGRPRPPGTK